MSHNKQKAINSSMHVRNRNRDRYDLEALVKCTPELAAYVRTNKYDLVTVDFANPKAVKALNKALLHHYYEIAFWEFPDKNLCPPIPGRADYLHHMADVLAENNFGQIPQGNSAKCLDIGVGASCIYPIIGAVEYGWNFIGSDIDADSISSAEKIIASNPSLEGKITCRLQKKPQDVFFGIIDKDEYIDLSICNPPFHASAEAAQKAAMRKVKNLTGKKESHPNLNFSGSLNELICPGGEYKFIHNMARESQKFAKNFLWFSSLVSKQSNLKGIYSALEKQNVEMVKTIAMGSGNKSSRIVAWTFQNKAERKAWREKHWQM